MGWFARTWEKLAGESEGDPEDVIDKVRAIRDRAAEDCRALDVVISDLNALLGKEGRDGRS